MTISERLKPFLQNVKPFNKYSQMGEDGLIQDVFNRIGTANKWVMECGAADGIYFSNSRKLIEEGWSAVLIEGDLEQFEKLAKLYAFDQPYADSVEICNRTVESSGVNSFDAILANANAPKDLDLAIIDVDGEDYHLWSSMLAYRPRVVVCEFNPQAEDPRFIPPIGGEGQAGVEAVKLLGIGKLYYPVAQTYCNLIFVRQDLLHLLTDDPEPVRESEVKESLSVRLAAAMSTPRIGFLSNSDCVYTALGRFGIPLSRGEGCFWHHSLSRAIQTGIDKGAEYILTLDYDTLFIASDIAKLVCLLADNPDVDVVVALQQKREGGELLASGKGDSNLIAPLNPIRHGHFGLTLFRSSVFNRIKKPWFVEAANEQGEWGEHRLDADIGFWKNCEDAGINVCLAMDVVVGHMELVCTWPTLDNDLQFRSHYQSMSAWRDTGNVKPVQAFDRERVQEMANAGLIQSAPSAALEMKD